MATYQLRPMSVGEILDGSLALLRRHLGLFFSLAVICLGLPAVLQVYTDVAATRGAGGASFLAVVVLRALGYMLLSGASVYAVSELYLGRTPGIGEALRFATPKMGRIFACSLAGSIVAGLATLLLIVPGVIVACGYTVAVVAVVLEDLPSGTDGLGRSWRLTKGFKGKAFTLFVVMVALVIVAILGLAFLVGIASAVYPRAFLPGMVLVRAVTLLLYPFSSCVVTLFYYDLRVRKEGLDLELLDRHLGAASGVT